ncbi:hypothetical protein KIPB_013688, partial [Kipferlia bialata]|eukprot:g13688.t1
MPSEVPPPLVFRTEDVDHNAVRQGGCVYLGPVQSDGQTPTDTLGPGERRAFMLICQNSIHPNDDEHCRVLTQNPITK